MEKIYCGSGTARETKFGEIVKIAVDMEALEKASDDGYGFITKKGKRMVKLDVVRKKEPDQYGATHYVAVDTWKPSVKDEDAGWE